MDAAPCAGRRREGLDGQEEIVVEGLTLEPRLDVAGVVDRDRLPTFERLLFRATRGNCYLKFSDLPKVVTDPYTGEAMHKVAYVVFFSGDSVREKVPPPPRSPGSRSRRTGWP